MRRTSIVAAALACAALPASAGLRPAWGGVVRVAVPAAPRDGDPARALDVADVLLARATSAPLLEADPSGRLAPGLLAEVPAPAGDGRTFRLRLRPGLRTASGRPIEAADVAASLQRLLSFGAASPHAWLALPIAGADAVLDGRADRLAGVEVVSPLELAVTLAFPFPEFPAALAAYPLAVPGAGPFVAPPGAAPSHLLPNPLHHRGLAYAAALELVPADARQAPRLLERGAVDLVLRPEAAAEDAASLAPRAGNYAALNAARLGASAAPVRRALASVDRGELARRFVRGPAVPLLGLLPPSASAPAPAEPLAPGGLPPKRVRVLVADDDPDQRGLAARLQVKLFDAGLRAVLEPADRVRFGVRLRAGDYDVALVSVPWPSPSPPLAAAAVAYAIRGPAAARRALAALAGLQGDALAAAAQRTLRELDLVPLVATGLRLSRGAAVEGAVADAHGPIDPGALWRAGGGPLAP